MSLSENPIYLTQKRLVHRAGVLAAVLIACLLGLSIFAGFIGYICNPIDFHFASPREAGKIFYGWIIGLEALVMIIGVSFRVSRALADDRKSGLWDSNRLTPLHPRQIIAGYWFGAGLREFYASVPLAASGLVIVLLARLPILLWVGSQILILSSACFFALLCLLAGLVFERQQGVGVLVLIFVLYPFSIIAPSRMLTNFLLPTYSITYLFHVDDRDWIMYPHIFGVPVHPILLSLGAQLLVGLLFWRAAVRKTTGPTQPVMSRWQALALFAILIGLQHGLIWNIWQGHFPALLFAGERITRDFPLLQAVQAATLFIAVIILGASSPIPETVRIESLRRGREDFGSIFARSAVGLALALALVTGAGIFSHCMFSIDSTWRVVLAVTVNVAELLLTFTLLLEFCRARHKQRAVGFIALWLFILWVLPFILALVFMNSGFARLSLLSPGFIALINKPDTEWTMLFWTELAHFGVVVLLFLAWLRQWKRLLAK